MYPPDAILAEGAPLGFLCAWIESQVRKPVLDETGLTGRYDWRIRVYSFDPADLNAALKEIGLALTPGPRKVEYIVVRGADDPAGRGDRP